MDAVRPSSAITGRSSERRRYDSTLADALEEAEVLGEAAERDVLAVVGRRRGVALALGKRLDGAAERRPRLVERDGVTLVGELERRSQAGQTASDNGDVHGRMTPAPTMRSFVSGDSCGGPPNTSKPRSSIRSSVTA